MDIKMELTTEKKSRWPTTIYEWLKMILTILLVVGIGVFAVNQILEYRYKAEFLQGPCKLCSDLNPKIAVCFDNQMTTYFQAGKEITRDKYNKLLEEEKNKTINASSYAANFPMFRELLVNSTSSAAKQ